MKALVLHGIGNLRFEPDWPECIVDVADFLPEYAEYDERMFWRPMAPLNKEDLAF